MKGQYEQQCNAAALQVMGVPVIKSLKKKYLSSIISWTKRKQNILVNYPDITEEIINHIIKKYSYAKPKATPVNPIQNAKQLRKKNLTEILKLTGK